MWRLATPSGRPYTEGTAAFLPSSLGTSHSFALVFSTGLPVSVCGTGCIYLILEVFLGSALCKISLAVAFGFPRYLNFSLKRGSGFSWKPFLQHGRQIQ